MAARDEPVLLGIFPSPVGSLTERNIIITAIPGFSLTGLFGRVSGIDKPRPTDVLPVFVLVVVEPDGVERDVVFIRQIFDDALGRAVQLGGDDSDRVALIDILGNVRLTFRECTAELFTERGLERPLILIEISSSESQSLCTKFRPFL